MKKWLSFFTILVFSFALIAVGFNLFNPRSETRPVPVKRVTQPSPQALAYFPSKMGTRWTYFGLAEYSQTMDFKSINKSRLQWTYNIAGKVGDPSGGASKRNFNFRLLYLFSNSGVFERILQADTPFPHRFKSLKLLEPPFRKGKKWSQTVMLNSKPAMLKAEIIDISMNSRYKREVIRVRYTVPMAGMPNGIYEEVREFAKGLGEVHFEKTFGPKPEDRFTYNLSKIEIPGQTPLTF